MKKIGIIGAGISGLSLAWYLQNAGHAVSVFEKSGKAGGAISTFKQNGWLTEEGPGSLLEVSEHITDLFHDLDLEDELIEAKPEAKKRYIVYKGEPRALPTTIPGFFKTDLLSLSAKLKVCREPFIKKSRPDIEESLADFVRRRLGDEILDRFINPFVGGIYAGDPEQLSVRHAFPRLYKLEQEFGSLIKGQIKGGLSKDPARREISRNSARMLSFKDGLETLPMQLTKKLESVTLHKAITKVEKTEPGFTLHSSDDRFDVDIVVYAGSAHGLEQITLPDQIRELSALPSVTYPPVKVVSLGFKKDQVAHPVDGFGMLVPQKEKLGILGTQFNSAMFAHRVPDDEHVLFTTFTGGMRQPEIAHYSDSDSKELVVKELRKLLGITGDPVFVHQRYWPKAIPQYQCNYSRYLDIIDNAEVHLPGFYIAGNFRTGISLGDSIMAAQALSERIISSITDN